MNLGKKGVGKKVKKGSVSNRGLSPVFRLEAGNVKAGLFLYEVNQFGVMLLG